LEEGDVLGLGEADGLDVEELLGGEAETEELIVGEGGEGLLVEGILEMFQRESAVTRLVSFFLSLSFSVSLLRFRRGAERLTIGGHPSPQDPGPRLLPAGV
jgi:hypothetical protein